VSQLNPLNIRVLTNIKKFFHMKKSCLLVTLMFNMVPGHEAQTLSREKVIIETPYGTMKVRLYEETPLHKTNFLKLTREGFYDSLLFHRVINQFMIQGGDPLSKRARAGDSLGHGDPGFTVPAEFNADIFHRKGTLCAARESDEINPQRASSGSQFYIVMGKVRTMEDLKKYEDRINRTNYNKTAREYISSDDGKILKQKYNRLKNENKVDSAQMLNAVIEENIKKRADQTPAYKFTEKQVKVYTTVGGTPHLDGSYTVFGEVVEGLDVIDKIAAVKTDKKDRPIEDIRMKVRVAD
jgi:cyclophilin family peptidyl-prolyl cis-trans isomerase